MVQWLRLCLPMQEAWVRSLVRELRSHMPWGAAKNLKKKNLNLYFLKVLTNFFFLSFSFLLLDNHFLIGRYDFKAGRKRYLKFNYPLLNQQNKNSSLSFSVKKIEKEEWNIMACLFLTFIELSKVLKVFICIWFFLIGKNTYIFLY